MNSQRLLRRRGNLPQVAIWIGEVATVSAPGRGLRGLDDPAAGTCRLRQQLVDFVVGGDDLGERETVEAAAVGAHPSVLREGIALVEPQGGRALTHAEGGETAEGLVDRAAEALAVESLHALEVLDAERDSGFLRLRHRPLLGRPPRPPASLVRRDLPQIAIRITEVAA